MLCQPAQNGLFLICTEMCEGTFVKGVVVGSSGKAPEASDILGQMKAQMGRFPHKEIGQPVFLYDCMVQLVCNSIFRHVCKPLIYGLKKQLLLFFIPILKAEF